MYAKVSLTVLGVVAVLILLAVYLKPPPSAVVSLVPAPHEHLLSKNKELVKRQYNNIFAYMVTVYPLSVDVLKGKSPEELVDMYDTLDIVFNCVRDQICVSVLPDGYFYLWKTYASKNMYSVHSSGDLIDGEPISRLIGGSNNPTRVVGPAPLDFPSHAYTRNIYYPFGPIYDDAFTRWTYLNGIDVSDKEGNMGFLWKHRNWAYGLSEGESVEVVAGVNQASSPGTWLIPFYGGGTGVRYTVGKTVWAVNKVDMLMKLLHEYKEHDDAMLLSVYGTSDPYIIIWGYCNGMNNAMWGALARDIDNNPVIYPQDYSAIPCTGILAATGLLTKGKIGQPVTGATCTDAQFSDIAMWYSHEYGMYDHEHSHEESIYGMIKFSIDAVCAAEDWILDRVCLVSSLDEPIFWLGSILGYKTLQMTVNASLNGTWQPLIVDLSLPRRWKQLVQQRKYVFIEEVDGKPGYTREAQRVFAKMAERMLSSATVI
jgi:hypothetical protein